MKTLRVCVLLNALCLLLCVCVHVSFMQVNKLADALEERVFAQGEYIIRQGEEGYIRYCLVLDLYRVCSTIWCLGGRG